MSEKRNSKNPRPTSRKNGSSVQPLIEGEEKARASAPRERKTASSTRAKSAPKKAAATPSLDKTSQRSTQRAAKPKGTRSAVRRDGLASVKTQNETAASDRRFVEDTPSRVVRKAQALGGLNDRVGSDWPEMVADLEFLNENPFQTTQRELKRRHSENRKIKNRPVREDPLLDLTLLADPEEALIKGVSVIRQCLRDLFTGETMRLLDTSDQTELEALGRQLELRKLILEAALKELTGQLTRVRNRQREPKAVPRDEQKTHAEPRAHAGS